MKESVAVFSTIGVSFIIAPNVDYWDHNPITKI